MYKWRKVRELKSNGMSIKNISRKLKISRNTVRKYLRQESPPRYSKGESRESQWKRYEKEIKAESTRLLPSVIYENLKEKGASGSKSGFYNFFNSVIKGEEIDKLSMRYETRAGYQTQFDWAEYIIDYKKSGRKKVYILSMILGYSRYRVNVASEDVVQLSLFQSIEIGFKYFGGVPEEILIDNPRQFIDNANYKTFKINKKFENFAAYYKCRIHPCKVRHPQTKGKIENTFSYLENHFIKNNEFEDFLDLSKKLSQFTEKVNKKYHAGIGNIPREIFLKREQRLLKGLPSKSYFETFNMEIRQVNHTGTINYKGVSYSVPVLYSHKKVRIEAKLGYKLNIYSMKGQKIAEHLISREKGGIVVKKEHYEVFLKREREDNSGVKKEFLRRFPGEERFIERLKKTRKTYYLKDLSKIIRLSEYYREEDVRLSIEYCEGYEIYSYDMVYGYLKTKCEVIQKDRLIEEAIRLDEIYIETETRELNYYDKIRR